MCGIIGVLSNKSVVNKNFVYSGIDLLKHRGPDSKGNWSSDCGRVILGHTRLSVIDLSEDASQPMKIDSDKIIITFNGEIYNFQELRQLLFREGYNFKTKSDTEVLLTAYLHWGIKFIERCHGMFSACIVDLNKNLAFLFRDRAGEKPLYYLSTSSEIYFASQLNVFFKFFDCRLDKIQVRHFFHMGFSDNNSSLINGIKKLPPGHFLTYNLLNGHHSVNKYWDLPCFDYNINLSFDEHSHNVEQLLFESVKSQLVSDVPLGICLSGGIDSGLITAMAAKTQSRIKTFTAIFPQSPNFNEKENASIVSQFYSTDHYEVECDLISPKLLDEILEYLDEPIIDSSLIPTYLITKAIRKYCTVALGGDGGDELFGGYNHYKRLLKLQDIASKLPLAFRKVISNTLCELLPPGVKGKNYVRAFGLDFEKQVPLIATYFDNRDYGKLVNFTREKSFDQSILNFKKENDGYLDIILSMSTFDFKNYLVSDILVKVDRASMANSLEMRAPFLDVNLINYSFSKLPSKFKVHNGINKFILREIAKKYLPDAITKGKKMGFSIPLASWFMKGGDWNNEIRSTKYQNTGEESLFKKGYIDHLLLCHEKGIANNSERLFAILLFQKWVKKNNLNF